MQFRGFAAPTFELAVLCAWGNGVVVSADAELRPQGGEEEDTFGFGGDVKVVRDFLGASVGGGEDDGRGDVGGVAGGRRDCGVRRVAELSILVSLS